MGRGPTPAELALPPYPGIALADVSLVDSAEAAANAAAALLAADVIGFDTESKPTFARGEVSTGPHLIQLATDSKAFLFPVERLPDVDGLRAVLESPRILKVGFGLDSDNARLKSKLGVEIKGVVDLAISLRRDGERNTIGAKTAVARVFGQHLQKSKRVSTSNWAQWPLTENQIRYAADDAQVALKVYRATQPPAPLPPQGLWRKLMNWLGLGRTRQG